MWYIRFRRGASGKEPACQCRRRKRRGFDPWIGEIPWSRQWQPSPVFLPGESPWTEKSGLLQSMGSQRVGHDWSDWLYSAIKKEWNNSICSNVGGPRVYYTKWNRGGQIAHDVTYMWGLEHESPLHCKEIQTVHPKGNQSWIFIGRTDAEAETPILWPPDVKSWLIWKDPDAGKDWVRAGGEGDDRGWDGWIASQTRWTGRPGVLQSTGSQRVRHDWVTELNWTENMTQMN